MTSNRLPYCPAHVMFQRYGRLATEQERHDAREIETQVARMLVRFLELPENAEIKAYIIQCDREQINDHSASIPMFLRDQENRLNLAARMGIKAVLHPDDDPLLYQVAYTKMTSFYIYGDFNHQR